MSDQIGCDYPEGYLPTTGEYFHSKYTVAQSNNHVVSISSVNSRVKRYCLL